MKRTVTHKNLKRQFDIFNETNEINELFLELEFSMLLLPTKEVDFEMQFPTIEFKDEIYVPVFTDIHEYEKLNVEYGYTLVPNPFEFYLDLLDQEIDGIVIDVMGERFPITKEFRDWIRPSQIIDYDPQAFTEEEMKNDKGHLQLQGID